MILSNCLIFIYHQNLLINSLAQKVFFMLVQSNGTTPYTFNLTLNINRYLFLNVSKQKRPTKVG